MHIFVVDVVFLTCALATVTTGRSKDASAIAGPVEATSGSTKGFQVCRTLASTRSSMHFIHTVHMGICCDKSSVLGVQGLLLLLSSEVDASSFVSVFAASVLASAALREGVAVSVTVGATRMLRGDQLCLDDGIRRGSRCTTTRLRSYLFVERWQ